MKNRGITKYLILLFSICTPAIHGQELVYTLFLIGDTGEPHIPIDFNLQMLEKKLSEVSEDRSGIVFLGDNLYPKGLPPEDSELRDEMAAKIQAQMDVVTNYDGDIFFIPGNHDWQKGKEHGYVNVREQEDYVEEGLGRNVFYPDDGCSGPVVRSLNDELQIILIDTQWLLHPHEKGNKNDGCQFSDNDEVYGELRRILESNPDKRFVIATHHPIFTNGIHGGRSNLRDHLFPLTHKVKWLYLPLPVIGSIYPIYRKYFGNIQDIKHETYQKMTDSFIQVLDDHPRHFFVSGHEHSLQFFEKHDTHFVVSGSGSKTTFVKDNKDSDFALARNGFAILSFYSDGSEKVEFWALDKKGKGGEQVYEKKISAP